MIRHPNSLTDGDLDIGFLHEIATRMSLAPPLHEVLREVVRFAAAVVECDSCFVYVLEKDELVLRASKNPHPEIIDRLKLKLGEGITGWVAEHREPAAVPQNAMKDPRFKFFNDLPEDRFEAFLSVPLMSRGRLVGVINMQNRKPHHYSKREISMISTVGTLVGAEIEMARLQDEERRRIGREVHDTLGQELTAAKLYLRRIPADSYADAHWSSYVKEAAEAVDRALQQVRSLAYLLHPPFAEDMGLLTALRYYVEGVSQRTGIQVKTKLPKELSPLPFEAQGAGKSKGLRKRPRLGKARPRKARGGHHRNAGTGARTWRRVSHLRRRAGHGGGGGIADFAGVAQGARRTKIIVSLGRLLKTWLPAHEVDEPSS